MESRKLFCNLDGYMKTLEDHLKKKQFCGYCPEDKCLLDCKICNPRRGNTSNCDC